jgi:hypothetical protein
LSRAADYTIEGFLYQFNKTLLEILKSLNDSVINVEGIVEDVEVVTPDTTTMIQCKYHETCEVFTPSAIFKPLLLMASHFYRNPAASVRYVLFAHFPNETTAPQKFAEKQYIQDALKSNNKELEKLVAELSGKLDIEAFLSRFTLEFGPNFDEITAQAHAALKGSGIPEGDIETLAYPNAINMIAGISVKHDPSARTTTRRKFLETLKNIHKTAISRWTMALRTRKQLLATRRKQLKTHLDLNSRLRYFVIDTEHLEDFEEAFVLFVKDFIGKYHFKQSHIGTPLFCLGVTRDQLERIERRLFKVGLKSSNGVVGGQFEEPHFFREPLCKASRGQIEREFHLRLLRLEDHIGLLNNRKYDDLFILGEPDFSAIKTEDVDVEHLATTSIKEVAYLVGVSNVYE